MSLSFRDIAKLFEVEERPTDVCAYLDSPDEDKCRLARNVIKMLEERLSQHDEVALIEPTGTGKTTTLLLWALTRLLPSGESVVYLVSGKMMREEALKRILSVRGEVKHQILVLFAKHISCINEEARSRRERPIELYMFECPKCQFNVEREKAAKIAESLSGRIFTNLSSFAHESVTNICEIGAKVRVCPFLIARSLLQHVDMSVLDHVYAVYNLIPELRDVCSRSYVIVDEAHVIYYMWDVHRLALRTLRSALRRIGSDTSSIERFEESLVARARRERADEYKRDGYVIFEDELAASTVESVVKRMDVERLQETFKGAVRVILSLLLLRFFIDRGVRFERYLVIESDRAYYYFLRNPHVRIPHKKLILSSATLCTADVAITMRRRIEDVDQIIVTASLPFERRSYVLPISTTFDRRSEVAEVVRKIMNRSPVIIANMSWSDVLNVRRAYEPRESMDERRKVIEEVKRCLGREPVLLSPYTSYAWGLDLVDLDKPVDLTCVVFENPPLRSLKNDLIVRFYASQLIKSGRVRRTESARKLAVLMTMVKRGICYSLQALGRFQRNHRLHRLTVIFVGKHFPMILKMFKYEDVYGKVEMISDVSAVR